MDSGFSGWRPVITTFAGNMSTTFKELSGFTENIEVEWTLFKSAVLPVSAGGNGSVWQSNSDQRTLWWIQGIKEAIREKKAAYNA
ncbi:unnamed protein product [Clavelina lepadiformis]|uniref:Uncharacterized protein n=1 Tax=Clavelina lepadiformis TaxID=159417 RepID=A0ABP0G266_CLALP